MIYVAYINKVDVYYTLSMYNTHGAYCTYCSVVDHAVLQLWRNNYVIVSVT